MRQDGLQPRTLRLYRALRERVAPAALPEVRHQGRTGVKEYMREHLRNRLAMATGKML